MIPCTSIGREGGREGRGGEGRGGREGVCSLAMIRDNFPDSEKSYIISTGSSRHDVCKDNIIGSTLTA